MQASDSENLKLLAQQGDPDAMTRLGMQLLLGPAPYEGAEMLGAAAKRGSAAACERVAVLAGAGACTPQSWPVAFDFLTLAAKLGSNSARQQLAIFSRDAERVACLQTGIPDEPDFWRCLRRSIDIETWLRPPPRSAIAQRPQIFAIEDLLPAACCHWLIEAAQLRIQPAHIYDLENGGSLAAKSRTNSEASFDIVQADLVLLVARARIAAAADLPIEGLEPTSVLHYSPGEAFHPHYDFLDPKVPGLARDLEKNGQRAATCLIYLNDAYSDGETDFPAVGIRYRGAPGSGLLFFNIDARGEPEPLSLHAGLPPSAGEKWLLSQFIRVPLVQAL